MEFPPEWQQLCLIVEAPIVLWNRDHPLTQAVSRQAWERLMQSPCIGGDPRPLGGELAESSELAAAWLLFCLSTGNRDLVKGIAEHEPELFGKIWNAAAPESAKDGCWAWLRNFRGRRLVEIGPHGWREYENIGKNAAVFEKHFPKPSDDWCVFDV